MKIYSLTLASMVFLSAQLAFAAAGPIGTPTIMPVPLTSPAPEPSATAVPVDNGHLQKITIDENKVINAE